MKQPHCRGIVKKSLQTEQNLSESSLELNEIFLRFIRDIMSFLRLRRRSGCRSCNLFSEVSSRSFSVNSLFILFLSSDRRCEPW